MDEFSKRKEDQKLRRKALMVPKPFRIISPHPLFPAR